MKSTEPDRPDLADDAAYQFVKDRGQPGVPLISVVLTAGDLSGPALLDQVTSVLGELTELLPWFEVVLVVDQRNNVLDDSWDAILRKLPNITILAVSAVDVIEAQATAGLDQTLGDLVVLLRLGIDATASVLPLLSALGDSGSAVGVTSSRRATGRRWSMQLVRLLASRAVKQSVPALELGSLAVRREVLAPWSVRRDRSKVVRMLPYASGLPAHVVRLTSPVSPPARDPHQIRQLIRAILFSSPFLLRWASKLALSGGLLSAVYALYALVLGLTQEAVEGWTTTNLLVAGLSFLTCLVLAVMSEYVYQSNVTNSQQQSFRVVTENVSTVFGPRDALNVEYGRVDPEVERAVDSGSQEQPT